MHSQCGFLSVLDDYGYTCVVDFEDENGNEVSKAYFLNPPSFIIGQKIHIIQHVVEGFEKSVGWDRDKIEHNQTYELIAVEQAFETMYMNRKRMTHFITVRLKKI